MKKILLSLCLFFFTFPSSAAETLETAIFAGGCFWCMEKPFDAVNGVKETVSGYTGGQLKNPSYEQVSAGNTGHAEAVKIIFDPQIVSYTELLDVFWRNIDPLNDKGQFCDSGNQYRSGIFYTTEAQRKAARQSLETLQEGRFKEQTIATEITPATTFYPAEQYHQNYYQKNPLRYKYYRYRCGRDQRLEEVWGPTQK